MRNRDPEFIRIMYDMYDTNESKGEIYDFAFLYYAERGRILNSLESIRKNGS